MTMPSIIDRFSNNVIQQTPFQIRVRFKKLVYYGTLGVWLILLLFPLYWMFTASIRPTSQLWTINPTFVPREFTIQHWNILAHPEVAQYFVNTLIIATGVMALSTLAASVAGYGLTRYDLPFQVTFARIILFGYMISPIVLAIPMYVIYRQFGLLNTYLGVILAQSTLVIPFAVWLMWKMFQDVPIAEEEAAWTMGVSRWRTFFDIALPGVVSGLFAVGLFAFAVTWNDFTLAAILLPDQDAMTLSPGLMMLAEQDHYINPGELMVIATVMAAIPVGITYWLQDYLLEGFGIDN